MDHIAMQDKHGWERSVFNGVRYLIMYGYHLDVVGRRVIDPTEPLPQWADFIIQRLQGEPLCHHMLMNS
jgi:hypothetical protein